MKRRGIGIIVALVLLSTGVTIAQQISRWTPPAGFRAPRTPWGEPDLQGIWDGETLTPLQRPARFKDKPVLTEAEEKALVDDISSRAGRDDRTRAGTERDVANAYNEFWMPTARKLSDGRTGLIVDPADGQVPPMTAEAQKRTQETRDYLAALLQGTSGGRPGPISPRRTETPPAYNVARMNRGDGPEDRSTMERCFGNSLPYMAAAVLPPVYRIVQSPGKVAVYNDVQQGTGFPRVISTDNSPHLPASIRLYHGDSRGRWEGDTLVVDVTNFSVKTEFLGSRENLHLVERFTRVANDRVNYRVTVEDATTWARPWTFEVPWQRLADKDNQVYEATCQEGNYGLIGMLQNIRAGERLFKEGKGPDPATQDNATPGTGAGGIGR